MAPKILIEIDKLREDCKDGKHDNATTRIQ